MRAAAAERGIEPIDYEAFDRAALVRRPEGDYLEEKVSKGRARELRRLRRQLGEQLGGPIEVLDRSGDAEAVEGFLRAEAAGWKGREGTAFACTPEDADFFREVCARFGAAGRLQLLVMTAAGVDVAWKVNFVGRRHGLLLQDRLRRAVRPVLARRSARARLCRPIPWHVVGMERLVRRTPQRDDQPAVAGPPLARDAARAHRRRARRGLAAERASRHGSPATHQEDR